MADCVKVAVRIRPLVQKEKDRGSKFCVDVSNNVPQVTVTGGPSFTYNYVFDNESTQADVYINAVQPLLDKLFDGFNVTILAYGQTGSGKTYTMGSNCIGDIKENDQGIIHRSVKEIFSRVIENTDWRFKIKASFMELYKEQLYDLLAPSRTTVEIREDSKRICIPDLTEVLVASPSDTIKCLEIGSLGRATGATAMNQQSSRSHAIFTLTVQQQKVTDPTNSMTSKFHLVDLAGSERCKKTHAEGDRLQEGVKINHGLLILGNVIATLGEGGKRMPSYRDSKLTRLLQDSLGGNSYTLMIACVSPADYNLSETLSTLRYADRARRIKNKPVINQDPNGAEVIILRRQVAELQARLKEHDHHPDNSDSPIIAELKQQVKQLEAKCRLTTKSYNENLMEVVAMQEKLLLAETSNERLKERVNQMKNDIGVQISSFEEDVTDEIIKQRVNKLKKVIYDNLIALQDEQLRGEEEQRWSAPENNLTYINNSVDNSSDTLSELDRKQEEHAIKQNALNRELRELRHQIAVKSDVVKECEKTNDVVEETFQHSLIMKMQYEKQISELEKEKADLMANIQKLEVAKKEAEAKIKQSELTKKNAEIQLLHGKLAEHNKVVREKQIAEKRILAMQSELREMKQIKVRLIKQLKQESDYWKTWHVEREREAARLRDKDKKRDMEMFKLQSIHNKQQIVNKRKLEEAAAVNKRLKETLDRLRVGRTQQYGKFNKEKIQEIVSREVDMLISTGEGKRTLKEIINCKDQLLEEMAALRRRTIDAQTIKQLSEMEVELELRNNQIADLEQKLREAETDGKVSICDLFNNASDLKTALYHALTLVANVKKDELFEETVVLDNAATKELTFKDAEKAVKEMSTKIELLEKEITRLHKDHSKELRRVENQYQENLRNMQLKSNSVENVTKTELQGNNSVKCSMIAIPRKKTEERRRSHEFEDIYFPRSGDRKNFDPLNPKDWRQTPLYKRLKDMRNSKLVLPSRKRFGEGTFRCVCQTSCDTTNCYCTNMSIGCGENCECDAKKCTYKVSKIPLLHKNANADLNGTFTVGHTCAKRLKTDLET